MKFFITTFLLVALGNLALSASVAKPSCGGNTASKDILLVNPKNPPRECVYKINAYSSNVCQLRIDFGYTLAQPSIPSRDNNLKYVECDKDYFQAGDLRLCGTEVSQHIYLPFNRTAGVKSLDLSVVLANRVSFLNLPTPKWNIFVTQLECPTGAAVVRSVVPVEPMTFGSTIKDGFFVAPPGCLQYFPEPQGTVTSFNFDQGKGNPGRLNYAICFRRDDETQGLSFNPETFKLAPGSGVTGDDDHCSSNYLMIPQAKVLATGKRVFNICGDILKGTQIVSTNPGPLMVLFNSDGLYTKSSGFSFNYRVM